MARRGWAVLLAVGISVHARAAEVGTWRNYTSMQEVRAAAAGQHTVWCATSGGLFGWNTAADTYRRFTNAEGLRSLDLTAIAVDADGMVWTGSATGIIHVLRPSDGALRTITDIARSTQPNKRITSLLASGDTIFVCTEFGLSIFFRGAFLFGDTYTQFGPAPSTVRGAVRAAAVHDGRLWAALEAGLAGNFVASAPLGGSNILPPEAWTLHAVGDTRDLLRTLTVFAGRLHAGGQAGLSVREGDVWNPVPSLQGRNILAAAVVGSSLAVGTTAPLIELLDTTGSVSAYGTPLPSAPAAVFDRGDGTLLTAGSAGVLGFDTAWTAHAPNGPGSNQFISVSVDRDGRVWSASGFNGNGRGFSRFDGTTWTSFRLASGLPAEDYYRVSATCDGSVWVSSWGWGVVEMRPASGPLDTSRIFGTNVGMVGLPNDPDYLHVSTVQCDDAGSHWMTVNQAVDGKVLVRRTQAGIWQRVAVRIGATQVTSLIDNIPVDRAFALDGFGTLWAACRDRSLRGLAALSVRGLSPDATEVTAAFLLNESTGLQSGDVRTVVVDKINDIWVGTDRGIAIILEPDRPTRPGAVAAYRPLNGIAINTIAVDPINRKWVGTPEGVILLSADGTQTLATYTVENTGGRLIENDVKSIALDSESGTVYFGTSSGLASLTTSGAAPRPAFDRLALSPNPYVVPSETPLTVDGLVENSSIKILSLDGRLVRALTTPGGRIGFWDGRDEDGRTVPTGIYLVVAYSEDGSEVTTGKVAVVRR